MRLAGLDPQMKGAKEDRRGPAGSDPRSPDRMGSGLHGPRPAEEARAADSRDQGGRSGLPAQTRREDEMKGLLEILVLL